MARKTLCYVEGTYINGTLLLDKGKLMACDKTRFKCKLCGNYFTALLNHVKQGVTNSCGCLILKNRFKNTPETHGMSSSRFYNIYLGIKKRCENSKCISYGRYGGRGIKCEWNSFEDFKNDMYEEYNIHIKKFGEKDTSIDRKNTNGNYYKENCRCATLLEQGNNKEYNRFGTYKGETHTRSEWLRLLGFIYI